MNKRLQVRTLSSLGRSSATAETAYRDADRAVDDARHALNQAKASRRADPCDYTAAKEQAAQQEYDSALVARSVAKETLRVANQAKRQFVYDQKPSLTATGRLLRH